MAHATHNRAGEITYRYINGLTYEVTITTYTKSSSSADRCTLEIYWGDNSSTTLKRTNGAAIKCTNGAHDGELLGSDIKKNIYIGTHTYATTGVYSVHFEDANRNASISNIPNSINVPFYVESEIVVSSSFGHNSSPVLVNPPLHDGCKNQLFVHNPGAHDPDGDSLSYRLVDTRGLGGNPITSTYNVTDSVKINERTGDLFWKVPKQIGEYNFAIEIAEWRLSSGRWVKIGFVTRDLQVDIKQCQNQPPIIQPVGPFCVEAGKNLNFTVTATDPDSNPMTITAYGSPFEVDNPADSFYVSGLSNPLSSNFNWNTACNHVRRGSYFVTFEVVDNPPVLPAPSIPLAGIYTAEIRVLAPSPKNPTAVGGSQEINLTWDQSVCQQAEGYLLYRKEDTYGFNPDTCETGVPEYTEYVFHDSLFSITSTSYRDTMGLKRGVQYCYMVVAYFKDESQSFASVEFCANALLDAPLITRASVLNTNDTSGVVEVNWIFPPQLDSGFFPPPYTYKLFRAEGTESTNFTEVPMPIAFTDTSFTDSLLNTQDHSYIYYVELYSNSDSVLAGTSTPASTPYLEVIGWDKINFLDIKTETPWRNDTLVIFRETEPGSTLFDSIGLSYSSFFIDSNLTNGKNYCYLAKTIGAYTANDSLPQPLINFSQIACATPIDTTKPCPPTVLADYNCEQDSIYFYWEYPQDSACKEVITAYNLYYKSDYNDPWPDFPTVTITNGMDLLLLNEPITGCWSITSVDDAGLDSNGISNESLHSNVICIESCPTLVLPNVFTPNGDGVNDFFLPISYNDVSSIELTIVNRWGVTVYESKSKEEFFTNGWDGIDQNSGQLCADGVFFYVCRYYPSNYKKSNAIDLNGFIHLYGN